MKLILGYIVRNEAPMLKLTLPIMMRSNLSHIVALDAQSEDKTREVFEVYGVKIWQREWTNDFAAARNALLDHVRDSEEGDWLFMLDADEVIDLEGLSQLMSDLVLGRFSDADALAFPRLNLARQGTLLEIGSYPDWQVRCIRLGSGVKFERAVHEVVVHGTKIQQIPKCHIYHYGWCKSIPDMWLRTHNYVQIEKGEPVLEQVPELVFKVTEDEFWKGMTERHKFMPVLFDHPLKGRL